MRVCGRPVDTSISLTEWLLIVSTALAVLFGYVLEINVVTESSLAAKFADTCAALDLATDDLPAATLATIASLDRLESRMRKMEAMMFESFLAPNDEALHSQLFDYAGGALFMCDASDLNDVRVVGTQALADICNGSSAMRVTMNSAVRLPPHLSTGGFSYGTTAHGVLMLLPLMQAAAEASGSKTVWKACLVRKPRAVSSRGEPATLTISGLRYAKLALTAEAYALVTGVECLAGAANHSHWSAAADFCRLRVDPFRSFSVSAGEQLLDARPSADSEDALSSGLKSTSGSRDIGAGASGVRFKQGQPLMAAGYTIVGESESAPGQLFVHPVAVRGHQLQADDSMLFLQGFVKEGMSGGHWMDSSGLLAAVTVGRPEPGIAAALVLSSLEVSHFDTSLWRSMRTAFHCAIDLTMTAAAGRDGSESSCANVRSNLSSGLALSKWNDHLLICRSKWPAAAVTASVSLRVHG